MNAKDTETKKEALKLEEKDFIHEEKGPNPFPAWIFIAGVGAIFSILWLGSTWYFQKMETAIQESPFLQVTNRQFSLFLWQNPEYMRNVSTSKTAYLPGYYSSGPAGPKLETAGDYVSAPPEVIFRYHAWKRLLGSYVMPRKITPKEFQEFLSAEPEWDPKYWREAGKKYQTFIANLDQLKLSDLQRLPEADFPKDVRIAFVGWKNYYKEGELINSREPTIEEMRLFLDKYPNYAPNFWQNLEQDYLQSLKSPNALPETKIPNNELTSFLRAAFFNDQMALKERE